MKPLSLALNIKHPGFENFSLKSFASVNDWHILAPDTSEAGGFMRFYAMFSWNKVVSLRDTRDSTIDQFFFHKDTDIQHTYK